MLRKIMKIVTLIAFSFYWLFIGGTIEVKNLKCTSLDKLFSDFDYCYIRAINRSYKYISLKVNLYKVPITNITVSVDVRKRANGYKPFLYNVTFDACKFLRSRKNPLIRYFYSFIEKHSNMNHTCPYDHDIILDKLDTKILDEKLAKLLPVPEGEYGFFTTWFAYNIPRALVELYVKLS